MDHRTCWLTNHWHLAAALVATGFSMLIASPADAGPCIDSLSPTRGGPGTSVTITCSREADRAADFDVVLKRGTFETVVANPHRWTAGRIEFRVPTVDPGRYTVNLRARTNGRYIVNKPPNFEVTATASGPGAPPFRGPGPGRFGTPVPGPRGGDMEREVRDKVTTSHQPTDVRIASVWGVPDKVAVGDVIRPTMRVERDRNGIGKINLVVTWDDPLSISRGRSSPFSLGPGEMRLVSVDLPIKTGEAAAGGEISRTFVLEYSDGRPFGDVNPSNNERTIRTQVIVPLFGVTVEVARFYVKNDCDNGEEPGEWKVSLWLEWTSNGFTQTMTPNSWHGDLNDRTYLYESMDLSAEMSSVPGDAGLKIRFATEEDDGAWGRDGPGFASVTLEPGEWNSATRIYSVYHEGRTENCGEEPYAADVRVIPVVENPRPVRVEIRH
jgi:hypothetical protein